MTPAGAVTFRQVLQTGEFRALWLAELFSQAGDQFARVALSVLVYQRTSSALLTGLTYALTFLPSMAGGVFLGWLGDRFARRDVIVVTDLSRAVLTMGMAAPHVPLPVMFVLLATSATLSGPFKAAQLALLADVLEGDAYVLGLSIRHMTIQAAQVAGFLLGGVMTQGLNPRAGLAIDAATFLVSAMFARLGVHRRPAPKAVNEGRGRLRGVAVIARDPGLRALTCLSSLAGCYVVPEGLAAPYAHDLGAGTGTAVGVIMASDPIGSIVGAFLFAKLVSARFRVRTLGTLALLAGLPLVLCVFHPGLVVSAVLFGLSGALATGYHMEIGSQFVQRLPGSLRAQGLGTLTSSLITVQGLGAMIGGSVADVIGTTGAITVAGTAGILLGAGPALSWTRLTRGPRYVSSEREVSTLNRGG
jgi:predicted MFS family arabinose efflux permease